MTHYIPIPIQTVSCAFCCCSLLAFVYLRSWSQIVSCVYFCFALCLPSLMITNSATSCLLCVLLTFIHDNRQCHVCFLFCSLFAFVFTITNSAICVFCFALFTVVHDNKQSHVFFIVAICLHSFKMKKTGQRAFGVALCLLSFIYKYNM